jgi:hypothetical protein
MHKAIVYIDDATHARQVLAPLVTGAQAATTHWVLVACAPRMTHRISKWVSHSARENWRAKWADKLFAQVQPWVEATGGPVCTVLAKGPLPELLVQLQAEHGAGTPVVDARRPKVEQEAQAPAPVATPQPATPKPAATVVTRKPPRRWSVPGSLTSLGLLFMLATD